VIKIVGGEKKLELISLDHGDFDAWTTVLKRAANLKPPPDFYRVALALLFSFFFQKKERKMVSSTKTFFSLPFLISCVAFFLQRAFREAIQTILFSQRS